MSEEREDILYDIEDATSNMPDPKAAFYRLAGPYVVAEEIRTLRLTVKRLADILSESTTQPDEAEAEKPTPKRGRPRKDA